MTNRGTMNCIKRSIFKNRGTCFKVALRRDRKMSKQKKEWIIDYIRKSPNQAVMALDDEFVEKYIETFNATYFVSKTGVKRSSYLRRLMLAMCEEGAA